jgi:hypothetical protein
MLAARVELKNGPQENGKPARMLKVTAPNGAAAARDGPDMSAGAQDACGAVEQKNGAHQLSGSR